LPAPVVEGATATYVLSKTESLRVTASAAGIAADVVLTAAPTAPMTLRFPMALSGLVASSNENGTVSLKDATGNLVDVVDAPVMWDAQRDDFGDPANEAAVISALVPTQAGAELDLTPSMAYLLAPTTKYPVVIDPTFGRALRSSALVKGSGTTGNTASLNNEYYLPVGSIDGSATVYRAFVDFQVGRFESYQINSATLSLFQYGAESCLPQPMSVQPIDQPPFVQDGAGATTWATRPSPNTSSDWAIQPSFNTAGVHTSTGLTCGQPNAFEDIDVSRTVAGFAAGSLVHYGWELSGPWGSGENTKADYKAFCSGESTAPAGTGHCETTADAPVLSVTFTSELGLQSAYPLVPRRLNDRSTLYADTFEGNAVVAANDVNIRGVGLALGVSRYYNSMSTTSGAFGPGWTMSVGPDVVLRRRGSGTPGAWFDYQAPSGTVYGAFVAKGSSNNYYKPRNGINADLTYDSGSGDYKLTFDKSRMVYWFAGCSTCDQQLVKQTDRHGNAITYNYTSGLLSSITDTQGRALSVTYTGGVITQLADTTGRTWQYRYTGGLLTSYFDPNNKETDYSYTAGELTQIQDPAGSDANADRPTTNLGYTGGEVTSISYLKDTLSGGGSYDYALTYGVTVAGTLSVHCASADDDNYSTEVLDPNGHTTTYCFQTSYIHLDTNVRENAHRQVFDGNQKKQSSEYTLDSSPKTLTDANGQTTGASTSLTYGMTLTENLEQITEPADGTNVGGTTQLKYNDTDNPYLPTSVEDTNGQCTSYVYGGPSNTSDSVKGDLTDSYSGLAAPGTSHDCSGDTSGNHNHVDYNSDGTVKDTYSPNGSTNNADETVYTYYTSGTANHQLQWVGQPGGTRPSPGATCSASTTLCTGFTYDTLDRVASVTDGNNNTNTIHYDGIDRITEIDLGGATSCNGGHTNCYSYTFDAEGNLTQITDTSNRTRTVGYDRLNRQTSITVPGTSRTITDAYDGVGNLLSYTDGADTVSYGYDPANHLTAITDAAGSFTLQNDDDGNRTSITEPNGVIIRTSYHNNGQVSRIWTTGGTGLPGQYTYTYTTTGTTVNEHDHLQKLHNDATGADTYYGYDVVGRLCWAGSAAFSTCGASTNRSYGYGYDKDNDRIRSNTTSATTYFGYRINGELCYSGATSGTTVDTNCPATPSGDTTYNNDKAGNLTGTTTNPATITYNNDNQATSLAPLSGASGSDTISYLDHGNQLRYSVQTSTVTDTFDNGPLGITALTATPTGSGGTTTYYTRDPQGNLIDERTGTTTYYYLTDRQNSVSALIDSTGHDAGDYTYTPYGRITNTLTTTATANPWRYTSSYQDNEADNYYHLGARYYDQATSATFTQPDNITGSIANPHTINLYAYTSGDPINGRDPSGHFNVGEFFGGIATFVGSDLIETAAIGISLTLAPEALPALGLLGAVTDVGELGGLGLAAYGATN
jgi:RHS repeat-associated protein